MKGIFQHQGTLADMSFAVKEYRQPHFTSPFHFHDTYELILIAKSYGKLYVGKEIMNFTGGEVYMFGPGLPHCFLNERSFIESGETAHAIVIFFRKDFMGKDFFQKAELAAINDLLSLSSLGLKLNMRDTWLNNAFEKITACKGIEALLLLLSMLQRVSLHSDHLLKLNKNIPKAWLTREGAGRLEKVVRYIVENFKEDIDFKKAASLACLNEAAFCRFFKRRTEKTFSEFVNYVRVTHATNLLTESRWSITNICFECGYRNLSYFNRQFKKIIGLTPHEYRKNHLNSRDKLLTLV